jgi:aldehyde dehydrogenase (NAD+)
MTLQAEQNIEVRAQQLFNMQKLNQYAVANTTAKERIAKLNKLHEAVVVTYRQEFRDAMMADFQKPSGDVDLAEIFAVTAEIKHTVSHLRQWMRDASVPTSLAFLGSSSHVKYQPKGVCLIISPWNFPINLTLGPLVSAIAAGNTVIIKPTEHTPHTTAVISKLIKNLFPENEIAVMEGEADVATALLKLPFNHIFFTGSPQVGKIVMAAAAKNLSSVTLELGGKSPTVVDETANIAAAARRITWGKFFNAGQICIAPDYLLVHNSVKAKLTEAIKASITTMYGEQPSTSEDYTAMVNSRHAERVQGYLNDSVSKGAKILMGGKTTGQKLEPTLVENVPQDSGLMQNEIFGPVLPIIGFDSLEEVVKIINADHTPLAMYIYSSKSKNVDYLISQTRAGGTCVNFNDVHFLNVNLPFGGNNNSGIGRAHGIEGFRSFSDARAVYNQHLPNALEILMPPYNGFKTKVIELIVRWL